ncbi:MAG: DUF934 domain-containing protein [Alteraurantiacibacter sp.]
MADRNTVDLGTGRDDVQLRFRSDGQAGIAAVTVDAFLDQPDAEAVRIEPGDNVRELLPHLSRLRLVEVNFPSFADGRGYSAARIMREHGYAGELRAVGDVLVDQLRYMRRCGFDAFAPDARINEDDTAAALDRYDHVYQPAADQAVPIWKLRHG